MSHSIHVHFHVLEYRSFSLKTRCCLTFTHSVQIAIRTLIIYDSMETRTE